MALAQLQSEIPTLQVETNAPPADLSLPVTAQPGTHPLGPCEQVAHHDEVHGSSEEAPPTDLFPSTPSNTNETRSPPHLSATLPRERGQQLKPKPQKTQKIQKKKLMMQDKNQVITRTAAIDVELEEPYVVEPRVEALTADQALPPSEMMAGIPGIQSDTSAENNKLAHYNAGPQYTEENDAQQHSREAAGGTITRGLRPVTQADFTIAEQPRGEKDDLPTNQILYPPLVEAISEYASQQSQLSVIETPTETVEQAPLPSLPMAGLAPSRQSAVEEQGTDVTAQQGPSIKQAERLAGWAE